MKLNYKFCFIMFLVLVILLCCLGKLTRESFQNADDDQYNQQDYNSTSDNLEIYGLSGHQDGLVDKDGCVSSAGYSWCKSKSRCIKLSEESCPINNQKPGISASQIPPGEEDQYILKSEIVPPVCPACPKPIISCNKRPKCPPCPPCARCPDPTYKCKMVADYSANNNAIPTPILNDFSKF